MSTNNESVKQPLYTIGPRSDRLDTHTLSSSAQQLENRTPSIEGAQNLRNNGRFVWSVVVKDLRIVHTRIIRPNSLTQICMTMKNKKVIEVWIETCERDSKELVSSTDLDRYKQAIYKSNVFAMLCTT